MFSREYLDRLAAETTFHLDTLEKVLRLERLLNQVRRHPFLGDRLALKGGTAYDAALFHPLFVALSGVLDRPVTNYPVPHRPTLRQAELEEALAPVLRRGERPNLASLAVSIKPLVLPLVTLSDDEREYVERIQWGDFLPELVVKDRPELLERVQRHPGLLWKVLG